VRKVAVASTQDRGFYALATFKGELHAGTYALNGECEIHQAAGARFKKMRPVRSRSGKIVRFSVGESIYEMVPYKGSLFAGTENRGWILRYTPGKGWTTLGRVGGNAYSLCEYRDQFYLGINYGKVYRSGDGNFSKENLLATLPQDFRELIVHNDLLYALGYDYENDHGAIHVYDGKTWKEYIFPQFSHLRLQKAHVWNGWLWFTTSPYFAGDRRPPAGLWRWDGQPGSDPVKVFEDPKRAIGMGITDFNGRLYMAVLEDWGTRPIEGAALHRSDPGGETWSGEDTYEYAVWKSVPEAWRVVGYRGNLYVTTSYSDAAGGKVWRVFTEEVCDGYDNDGDGLTDEDLDCPPPAP
jgi:hypothetical protein